MLWSRVIQGNVMQETRAPLTHSLPSRASPDPPGALDAEIVAARLRRFRRARKLTLDAVAEQIGTSPQTVQRLETGNMTLSVEWFLRLCRVYEIDPTRPFEADGDREPCVVASLGGRRQLAFKWLDHQEAVVLGTPARGVFGVRMETSVGDLEAGVILLACSAPSLQPGNRDWGMCLVSVADEPPALRQVFETASGQWILTSVDRSGSAEFTGTVSWLARIITVIRHMPDIRDAPEMQDTEALAKRAL